MLRYAQYETAVLILKHSVVNATNHDSHQMSVFFQMTIHVTSVSLTHLFQGKFTGVQTPVSARETSLGTPEEDIDLLPTESC